MNMTFKTHVFTGDQDKVSVQLENFINGRIDKDKDFRLVAQSMCMVPDGVCVLITYTE